MITDRRIAATVLAADATSGARTVSASEWASSRNGVKRDHHSPSFVLPAFPVHSSFTSDKSYLSFSVWLSLILQYLSAAIFLFAYDLILCHCLF